MYNVLSHTPAIYTVKRVVTPLSSAYGNSVQRMKAYAITMVWRWKDEQHPTNQNRLSERNQKKKKNTTEHLHNVAIKKKIIHTEAVMKPTLRCQWWCSFSDGHTRYKRYLHHRARRRGKEKKKNKKSTSDASVRHFGITWTQRCVVSHSVN